MMLGSNAIEDKCRVCRGNGTNCHSITGKIDSPDLTEGKFFPRYGRYITRDQGSCHGGLVNTLADDGRQSRGQALYSRLYGMVLVFLSFITRIKKKVLPSIASVGFFPHSEGS